MLVQKILLRLRITSWHPNIYIMLSEMLHCPGPTLCYQISNYDTFVNSYKQPRFEFLNQTLFSFLLFLQGFCGGDPFPSRSVLVRRTAIDTMDKSDNMYICKPCDCEFGCLKVGD